VKFWIFFFIFLLSHCQIHKQKILDPYPTQYREWTQLLRSCSPVFRSIFIKVFVEGRFIESFHAEFFSQTPNRWSLTILDPLGGEVGIISFANKTLKIPSIFSSSTYSIKRGSENQFIINGRELPLNYDDIPCIIASRWKPEWFPRKNRQISIKNHHLQVSTIHSGRHLSLSIAKKPHQKICTSFRHSWLWGLITRQVYWCKDSKASQLTLDDFHLFLQWTVL